MKKFFNKFLAVALLSAAVAFVGCKDYDADINNLQGQIDELQSQIDEINSLIESGSVITSVESISNGIKVTLSNGDSYEITNGTDGTNGTNGTNGSDGADGSVVTIGENGNWYIDGVDTGLAAEGKDGQDGSNGTNGTNGSNGTNGNDGADGANGDYYVPNAETGYFDLYSWNAETNSYDVTSTDISFLAAGAITATVNADGTVTLFGLEGYEDGVVLGKVVITSLLASEVAGDGFVFVSGNSMPWVDNYYLLTSSGQTALSSTNSFSYVVNPTSATAPESWNLNAFAVDTRSSYSFIKSYNSIYALADGKATVTGKFDVGNSGVALEDAQELRFTLEANLEEGGVVTSNTAMAVNNALSAAYISNPVANPNYKTSCTTSDINRYTVYEPYLSSAASHEVEYDDADGVALEDYVFAFGYRAVATGDYWTPYNYYCNWLGQLNIFDYSFRFSLPTTYIGADEITNQQDFVEIVDGNLVVKNEEWGTSSIGRTPIVMVELMSDPLFGTATVLDTRYIKFQISRVVVEPEALEPLYAHSDTTALTYEQLYSPAGAGTNVEYSMDWETVNKAVYKELGLTYEEFVATYGDPTITYSDDAVLSATYNAISGSTTPTTLYDIQVNGKAKWGTTYVVTLTFNSPDEYTYRDVVLKNSFTVSEPNETLPTFSDYYVDADGIQLTKGRQNGIVYEMAIGTSEAFEEYLDPYKTTETSLQAKYASTLSFIVNKKNPATQTNIELSNSTATTIAGIQEQILSYVSPMELATEDVPMVFQIEYENGLTQSAQKDWTIRFVNPISVEVAPMSLKTLDMATSLDAKDYITVKFTTLTEEYVILSNGVWNMDNASKFGILVDNDSDVVVKISDLTIENGVPYLTYADAGLSLSNTNAEYLFTWDNKGTSLLNDFTGATVTVKVYGSYDYSNPATGGYALGTGVGELTILSTENSK